MLIVSSNFQQAIIYKLNTVYKFQSLYSQCSFAKYNASPEQNSLVQLPSITHFLLDYYQTYYYYILQFSFSIVVKCYMCAFMNTQNWKKFRNCNDLRNIHGITNRKNLWFSFSFPREVILSRRTFSLHITRVIFYTIYSGKTRGAIK